VGQFYVLVDGRGCNRSGLRRFSRIMARAKKKRGRKSDAETERFHTQSRAHIAQLAAEGRGRDALAEGARLLGIDLSKPVDFRLISVGGMRGVSPAPSAKCKV